MRLLHRIAALLLVGTAFNVTPAIGQSYPIKPIRIVTAEVGGSADFDARLIAAGITAPLGRPVIVENRPTPTLGELVATALPDGYTLLLTGNNLWIATLLEKKSYDVVKDFAPITLAVRAPNVLVVTAALPVKSIKDLIALAKSKPGALNYGRGTVGSPNHLSSELFNAMAGVDIVGIPYKGGGPALAAAVAGEVQMVINPLPSVIPLVKSGRLRALGVTSAKRSALFPELPTIADSGVPGYESSSTQGLFAPARTPAAVILRLNEEIVKALNTADAKDRLFNIGNEVVGSSPQEFAAAIKAELVTMGKVVKERGIRVE